jgi:O-antigen/teichoic acid export membrane protein
VTADPTTASAPPPRSPARRLVRGSSLLLTGRILSKGANFVIQVLIVRYLSQTAFGAFAYALSVVTLAEGVLSLGLGRAITRFVPIYHERGDHDRLFGSLVLFPGTIISLGLAVALLLHTFRGVLGSFVSDELAVSLLLVLIFLAPIQALDELLVGLFASFASARSIFFRKHVLAPALKLGVVLLLVATGGDVSFLAAGYVAVSAAGVAVYSWMLVRLMRQAGVFERFNRRTIEIPWREVFAFSIPLMTTDLVYIVMNTVSVILLERFHDTTAVASFRAVQPAAKLNQLIMASFATLYMPMASRLFARNDRDGINRLYWESATWIACFSFPIFALTFSIAEPITVLLFGARYQQSAGILALMAFGYYFNAALGFNGMTLKVFNRMRYVVGLNVVTALVSFALNFLLIPRFGAMGAAWGTLGALVFHNILKQAGLRLGTGISLFEWRYARVYVTVAVAAAALLLVQIATSAPAWASIALAGLASLLVLRVNRGALTLAETFPELMRLPLVRWIFKE